jgi:tetratricopeptide (TPR) repeat protein
MEPLANGSRLGRYQIEGVIGRGAGSIVYRARLGLSGMLAAVKTVDHADPNMRQQLAVEVAALDRVRHANVAHMLDHGTQGDLDWLATELVVGSSLGQWAADLPARQRVEPMLTVLAQIADGLGAIHDAGLLHLDLKPDNIRVEVDGRTVIIDLSVASLEERVSLARPIVGSPLYMAPEQLSGAELDRRADLYALGLIAYQLLSGALPSTAVTPLALMVSRYTEPALPLGARVTDVPASAAAIVDRLLERVPADRPASAQEVAAWMRRALGSPMVIGRRRLAVLPPRIVGREPLLSGLRRVLAARQNNSVLLEGPPEIGLTRILNELRTEGIVQGARVALAQGGTDTLPSILRQLLASDPSAATRAALLGADRELILSAYPTLLLPGETISAGQPDLRAARNGAARVLLRAAAQAPLLILVDDCERVPGDDLRTLAAAGLLVACSHKPELVRFTAVRRTVTPLLPSEMAEMARSMVGTSGPELTWNNAEALEGRPGRVIRLVTDWARGVPIISTEARGEHTSAGVDWPDAVENAQTSLLRGTPAEAIEWLGRPTAMLPPAGALRFDVELLLARARFQQGADGASQSHAARASLCAPTPLDRNRARLEGTRSALRAGHFRACLEEALQCRAEAAEMEDGDLAARWATLQARALFGMGRLWEARRLLRQLQNRTELDEGSRNGLRWTEADVAVSLCRDGEAQRLVDDLRASPSTAQFARLRVGLDHVEGRLRLRQGRIEAAVNLLSRARDLIVELDDPEFEACILADLAEALLLAGNLPEATDCIERALARAQACGARLALQSGTYALMLRAWLVGEPGDASVATLTFDALPAAWRSAPDSARAMNLRPLLDARATTPLQPGRRVTAPTIEDPGTEVEARLYRSLDLRRRGLLPTDEHRTILADAERLGLGHQAARAAGLAASELPNDSDISRSDERLAVGDKVGALWVALCTGGREAASTEAIRLGYQGLVDLTSTKESR